MAMVRSASRSMSQVSRQESFVSAVDTDTAVAVNVGEEGILFVVKRD